MADNNHQLVFSDADYEKAAKQWGKEFLLMPLYSCMETLKYMTGMPGTRYKVALPTVEGNAQFAPYRSDRRSNDQTRLISAKSKPSSATCASTSSPTSRYRCS